MEKHKIASLEIEEDSTLVDLKGIAPNTILVIASGAAGNIKMLVPKPDTTLNQETITRTAGLCRVFKDGRWQWAPC